MIRIKASASRLENALVFREKSGISAGIILCKVSNEVRQDLRAARSNDMFTEILTIVCYEIETFLGDDLSTTEREFVERQLKKYVWSSKP